MDIERLNKLVKHPDLVSFTDIDFLNEVISDYPYFQAARLLLANASKDSEQIKTAAVYTAHRSVLKKVINKEFDADINLPNINNLELDQDDFNAIENLQEPFENKDEVNSLFTVHKNNEIEEEEELSFDAIDDLTIEEPIQPEEETLENTHSTFTENNNTEDNEENKIEVNDVPFYDVSFDEPTYDYPESSEDDEFFNESEDELEIYNKEDVELSKSDLTSSYDELMASLEELKKTRQNNLEDFHNLESKAEQEEDSEEQVQLSEEIFNEERSEKEILIEQKENETASEINKADGFALDSLINEYESNKDENELIEIVNEDESNFALDALLGMDDKPAKPKRKVPKDTRSQQEIISTFISNPPQISNTIKNVSKKEELNQEDLAKRSVEEGSLAVSENLAQILTRQGKFEKAIEIYKALILKYPEKKAYFAARIEYLINKK